MKTSFIDDDFNLIANITIVGDSGVGKTNLLLRYCRDTFTENLKTTIGVDFYTKYINVQEDRIKLKIFDTAGQERFRAIVSTYYRNSNGIVLVYDITNRNSFNHLSSFLKEIKNLKPEAKLLVVGNKTDLGNNRHISFQEGVELATDNHALFAETSAKTNLEDCVGKAMGSLIESIYQAEIDEQKKIEKENMSQVEKNTIQLFLEPEIKEPKCPC